MEKDKLILSDGTEIELETGAMLNSLGVLFPGRAAMAATWERFTPENLREVQIKNAAGLTVGSYTDLILVSETSEVNADGTVFTCFNLRTKTDVEKRLDAVEEGQAVQDGAIMDTAEVLSAVVEKQEGGTA